MARLVDLAVICENLQIGATAILLYLFCTITGKQRGQMEPSLKWENREYAKSILIRNIHYALVGMLLLPFFTLLFLFVIATISFLKIITLWTGFLIAGFFSRKRKGLDKEKEILFEKPASLSLPGCLALLTLLFTIFLLFYFLSLLKRDGFEGSHQALFFFALFFTLTLTLFYNVSEGWKQKWWVFAGQVLRVISGGAGIVCLFIFMLFIFWNAPPTSLPLKTWIYFGIGGFVCVSIAFEGWKYPLYLLIPPAICFTFLMAVNLIPPFAKGGCPGLLSFLVGIFLFQVFQAHYRQKEKLDDLAREIKKLRP